MMHLRYYLIIFLLLFPIIGEALEIQQIERLFANNDIAELSALQQKNLHSNDYPTLFLHYRLAAALIQSGDKKTAKKLLSRAIKQGKKITSTTPENQRAEHLILMGAMYGLKIIVQPFSAIGLNGKAKKSLKKAQQLDPENPRALLMLGVAKFQTPALFGGSKKKALVLLQQGLAGWTKSTDAGNNNWGQIDLHLWLGRVLADSGNDTSAESHYRQALDLSPDNHWVLQAIEGDGFSIK